MLPYSLFFLPAIFLSLLSSVALAAPANLIEGEISKQNKTLTLDQCFQLTLKQNENLQIREEQFNIAQADYQSSIAAIYPQLSYNISQTIRDNANFGRITTNRKPGTDDPATPVGGSAGILGKTQAVGMFSLSQNLFTGFREYLLSDAANMEISKVQLENIRAKELLYKDVSDLFYQILYTEKEILIVEQSKRTLQARVKELNDFIKLGKSRASEVLAARSEIAQLEANYEQLKGLAAATKELLTFLTGIEADQLRLADQHTAGSIKDLKHYLEHSRERSDVKASKILIEAENLRLKAVHRERWPQIGLSANAYTYDDPDRTREWDMLINLSLPIFDGGRITAKTASSEARLRTATLRAKQVLNLVERDIRVAYANLSSAKKQIKALDDLKSVTKQNYNLQKIDYNNGVVTNLEVLQALRQMQETERRLLQTQSLYHRSKAELKVASGDLTL